MVTHTRENVIKQCGVVAVFSKQPCILCTSTLFIGMYEVFTHYASTLENFDSHFHFQ